MSQRNKPFNRFELNYIKAVARHVTLEELAHRMGRGKEAVKKAVTQVDTRTKDNWQRPWTDTEVEYLRAWYPIDGAKRVATALNRTPRSIRSKVVKLGITRTSAWTDDDVATLKEHYAPRGARYVAEQIGRPVPHVRSAAQRYGVAAPRD